MIILSCRHLTKSFGIDEILRDVTFNINEGDKVGLIGPNGEGKSTLFKILTKQLDYDSGELFLDKNKIQLDELKEELLEWEEFPYEQQKALDKLICTLDKINETLQ